MKMPKLVKMPKAAKKRSDISVEKPQTEEEAVNDSKSVPVGEEPIEKVSNPAKPSRKRKKPSKVETKNTKQSALPEEKPPTEENPKTEEEVISVINDSKSVPIKEEPIENLSISTPAKPSRKKKSKGRNGNIYIGVFNRIEWLKLQTEFGFETVNSFSAFVLETMRHIRGDIQFCCDMAVTSGVYPDVSHYEWKDGIPHAVNHDGHHFIPEPVEVSPERQAELAETARILWEQRLELRKQTKAGSEVITHLDEGEEEVNPPVDLTANQFPYSLGNDDVMYGDGDESQQQEVAVEATLTTWWEGKVNEIWNTQETHLQGMENQSNLEFNEDDRLPSSILEEELKQEEMEVDPGEDFQHGLLNQPEEAEAEMGQKL